MSRSIDTGRRPFVSIIVPVRNGEHVIGDCIASLLRVDYPQASREILVVDNGSSDRTADIVRRYPVICLCEPLRGPSCARNRGIRESRGDILAFTDADCVVSRGWLTALVDAFEHEGVWGVAGEILPYPPRTAAERYMAERRAAWQKPALESRSGPYAVTANVAFRREVFRRVGLFDPWLPRGQDRDFGRRCSGAGLTLRYSARGLVLHRHRATTWGFVRQQIGWGYGAALLHFKYRLPWGPLAELGRYGDLLRAVGRLLAAAAQPAAWRDRRQLEARLFDVLREAARRVGAVQGLIVCLCSPRRRRGLRSLDAAPLPPQVDTVNG